MTCSEFRDALAGEFEGGFAQRFALIVADNQLYEACLDLAYDKDVRIAFRAAYALESAFWLNPELFTRKYSQRLVTDYLKIGNASAHRHYTKMLSYMLNNNLVKLSPQLSDSVAEKSFDLLIDEHTRPAVKVWCMEILYTLSKQSRWIADALYDTIQHQMQGATPALCNRGAKICKRLKQTRP